MTASATAPTREKAERARENSERYAVCSMCGSPSSPLRSNRRHASSCETTERSARRHKGVASPAGDCSAPRPAALPAGQTCELRVGPEFFYLGSDTGPLAVRRAAPDGDAVVTMPADTLYSLLTGQTTVTDAVRHATVDGDTEIARRALEPLAAA